PLLPTAHTSLLAAPATPSKPAELLVGVGTTLQLVPLKCSASVWFPLKSEVPPTAQMSLAASAAAPTSDPGICGLGTMTRDDNKLRSPRGPRRGGARSARACCAPRQGANRQGVMTQPSKGRNPCRRVRAAGTIPRRIRATQATTSSPPVSISLGFLTRVLGRGAGPARPNNQVPPGKPSTAPLSATGCAPRAVAVTTAFTATASWTAGPSIPPDDRGPVGPLADRGGGPGAAGRHRGEFVDSVG